MGEQRYFQNIKTHNVSIRSQPTHRRRIADEHKPIFLISESRGGGQINIDLEKFTKLIRFLEDLIRINDFKEKEKHIDFSENIRFHRKYIFRPF